MKLSEIVEPPAHGLRPININSPAFKSWFGYSKVVDGQGHPLICFRGTRKVPGAAKFVTKRTIPSFVASPDVASVYALTQTPMGVEYSSGATVSPVYLAIRNPLDLSGSEQITLSSLIDLVGGDIETYEIQANVLRLINALRLRDEDGRMPFQYSIPNGIDWEDLYRKIQHLFRNDETGQADDLLNLVWVDVYPIIDTKVFLDWAKSRAFDGVIHTDVFDVGVEAGRSVLGKTALHGVSDSNTHITFRPFSPTQVKSVFNRGTWDPNKDSMSEQRQRG